MIAYSNIALRISAAIALSAATMMGATACSDEVKSGSVVRKNFEPAHDERVQGACMVYSKVGSTWVCTAHSYYTNHISDRWTVTLENSKGDRSTWGISQKLYNDVKVGQNLTLDGE